MADWLRHTTIHPHVTNRTNLTEAPADGLEGVGAVVLFYPHCGFGARAASHGWRLKAPVLFLLAGADTIVPTQACLAIARQLAEDGHTVTTKVYEGITHAFDRTDLPLDRDLVYNAPATADARTRLQAFLASLAVVD